ncbi:hypothetical protein AA313_de0201272 [Arthrobotrys entomopaga]|nr:hypothetical protein AA313_de0201272 [Arthrobotrys entomopaga]
MQSSARPTEHDLNNATVVYAPVCGGRKLVRLGDKAIKYGVSISQQEADTMTFVRTHTSIPVPRVYDSYHDEEGHGYIVMDYIQGDTLENRWKHLDSAAKAKIAAQLRRYMDELRRIPAPSPVYIGGVNRTQANDLRNGDALGGPFVSETEFNEWLLSRILRQVRHTLVVPYLREQLVAQTARKAHAIVFTHSDFHPRNIMVDGDEVVGWLDWEVAGWFPEHWECIKAMKTVKTDWLDYLAVIIDEHLDEYTLDSVLNVYLDRF